MNSASVAVMRIVVLALVLAVQGLVHGAKDYPELVSLQRTASESFVSQPNVLEDVDSVVPSVVDANAGPKEEHFYTDTVSHRGLPYGKLDCLNDTKRKQPRLKFMRRDLPGVFVCEKKIFVIPVFEVELNRFFNVSLDFLKLENTDRIRLLRFSSLPSWVSVEFSSSGIMFVSGIIGTGEGTLTLKFDFYKELLPKRPLYTIKILFHIKPSEVGPNEKFIEFWMAPDQIGSRPPDSKKQIKAIKCAAKAVSLAPWNLRGVNTVGEFDKDFVLRAYAELPGNVCLPSPRKSCEDFSITGINFNNAPCGEEPQQDQQSGTWTSIEDVNHVEIKNDKIVTRPVSSVVSSSTPMPTTSLTSSTTPKVSTSAPVMQPKVSTSAPVTQLEVRSEEPRDLNPNLIDSGSPEVPPESVPPAVLEKQIAEWSIDDPKLRTALYGLLSLIAIVILVIFFFLFKRLELCKKKAQRYDPVFMERLSDDNAKFA